VSTAKRKKVAAPRDEMKDAIQATFKAAVGFVEASSTLLGSIYGMIAAVERSRAKQAKLDKRGNRAKRA
jgi:mannose/fructose/N-acetylgalactosamine-specific phosphotransferase system component IID